MFDTARNSVKKLVFNFEIIHVLTIQLAGTCGETGNTQIMD